MSKNFQNLKWMAYCFLKFIVRGHADQITKHPNNILIFQSSSNVGDTTCITPMFRAVKEKYPNCKLYVLCKDKPAEVVAQNPYIDEVVIHKNISQTRVFLKNKQIDFACIINASTEALNTLYLSGIPAISAPFILNYEDVHPITYNLIRKFVISIPFSIKEYMPSQYLRLLEPVGINTNNTKLELYYSKQSEVKIENLFRQYNIDPNFDRIIAIAPGGSLYLRWWASEKYSALIQYVRQNYRAKVFIIGAGSDSEPITKILKSLPAASGVVSLLNQPIDEFKAFLARTNLVIGNDSAPIVMAEALNVPTLMIVGPTDEMANHPPSSDLHRIVVAPNRGKPTMYAFHWEGYDLHEAKRQIDAVSLEMVTSEIDKIMESLTPSK